VAAVVAGVAVAAASSNSDTTPVHVTPAHH
jgi:hypothetical protein